jgi:hypothetical protein
MFPLWSGRTGKNQPLLLGEGCLGKQFLCYSFNNLQNWNLTSASPLALYEAQIPLCLKAYKFLMELIARILSLIVRRFYNADLVYWCQFSYDLLVTKISCRICWSFILSRTQNLRMKIVPSAVIHHNLRAQLLIIILWDFSHALAECNQSPFPRMVDIGRGLELLSRNTMRHNVNNRCFGRNWS